MTDLVKSRPIHLCVIDGISSYAGSEGPWNWPARKVNPQVLIVGRNPVCTDAVGAAVMGYDPMAMVGTEPFIGDNLMNLGAEAGIGTNDLKRIEVRGIPIANVVCQYGAVSRVEPPWTRNRRGHPKVEE